MVRFDMKISVIYNVDMPTFTNMIQIMKKKCSNILSGGEFTFFKKTIFPSQVAIIFSWQSGTS